ncbi:MAG: PA2169 family four-helix-bundle protein [Chloroflexi bacterium]|nr:PA2169 family four-helix-bundle protein [Chloroflexota bacterium]MCC6893668.1 PA2169 family four-helix-bundle protein [Anaerolineae bacterium]
MTQNSTETPSSINERLLHLLNELVEYARNGHDGYMEVANGINSAAYKTMFAEYALQRRRFAAQLANVITEMGGDPDEDGVVDAWSNIRAVIMGGDHGSIFAAIEEAEDATINSYEKTLEYETMPSHIREIIDEQCSHIIHAHDRIHGLREAYRKQNHL